MEATSVTVVEEEIVRRTPLSPGRPSKMTKDVLEKLEQAYLAQATDVQACLMAGITEDTLYYYQKKHPEFVARKKALQTNIALQAKQSVLKHIPRDGKLALDVIERLEKDKWSLRTELTGNEGAPLNFTWTAPKE